MVKKCVIVMLSAFIKSIKIPKFANKFVCNKN